MIIRSVNEIVIHLQSFRNIDLIFQGIYTIKVAAFQQLPNNKRIYAHPYQLTQSYTQPFESTFICTPRIDNTNSCFYSKSFLVRFFEQQIDINDICSFRIEFQISQQEAHKLQLEVSLLFYDYSTNKHQGLFREHLNPIELQNKVKNQSKLIQTKTLVLNNLKQPTHSFWPVLFNDHYFCELGMIVHSTCLDYRFRVSDLQLSQYVKLSSEARAKILQQNKKIDKKQFTISSSVGQSLKMSQQNPSKQILIVEQIVINQLKSYYERLYSHFQTMAAKCITDKDKSRRLKDTMLPNTLILPSEDPSLLKLPTHQRLTVRYKSIYPDTIITNILSQSNLISSQLVLLWAQTLELYKISPKPCRYLLQHNWMSAQKQIWGHLIERKTKIGNNYEPPVELIEFNKNKYYEEMKNKKIRQNLFDMKFYPELNELPVMIEHLYLKQKGQKQFQTPIQYKGIHLFVLVHGFQGSSHDMKLIKNYLVHLHPEAMLLSSVTNEDQIESDISTLGTRLANQVKAYVNDHCPEGSLGRLSFIGYSMGGLKIRAALPLLSQFKDIMHTFITFSTPHLGLLYPSSTLINAGIWFYNKMWKSTCLKQMSGNDAERIQDTIIYKLAHSQGLGWFKHILLLASRQDDYAPYQSARMQMCRTALDDRRNGPAYQKMTDALISSIKGGRLHRMDISFCIKQTSISSIIGRAAHIMFLDSHTLIKTLMFNYKSFFD